ncbi:MAG: twin-arginine translocation signal domain-containing protein [Trueperaceae bacterium]|nr:twin-arginine translocation signal domain-containing protein [Trueperaceae bacterium]
MDIKKNIEKLANKEISRRDFLRLTGSTVAATTLASVVPGSVLAQSTPSSFNEAPMLADMVAAGSLPTVAERLPSNPRIVPTVNEIGQYGGTWRRAFKGISDRWGPTKLNEEMAIRWDVPDVDTVNVTAGFVSEWTQNDDASEYTFTLRDGLKWSDGVPVSTNDVQFWYDEMYLGDLGTKPSFYTLNGVDMGLEIIDDLTFKVSFPAPNPLLPLFIAKSTGGMSGGPSFMAPAHYLSQYMGDGRGDQALIDAALAENGLATWQELFGDAGGLQGPIAYWFRNPELPVLNPWKAKNKPTEDPYIMERNPYFYGVDSEGNQLPYIDTISHALFSDQAVFDLWIAQGLIDFQGRHVQSANFTFYKESEGIGDYSLTIWKAASTNAVYPNINNSDPVLAALFDTAQFREALSIAINREEINDLIFDGLFEPRQASPVSGSPNYDPEFETRWAEYDPDRANALLDELGLTAGSDGIRVRSDGNKLSFSILHQYQTGTPEADQLGMVAEYWKAIGLDVSQDVVERSLYETRVQNGEVDVGAWGFDRSSIVMADPGRFIGSTDDGPWAPLYGHYYDNSPYKQAEPPEDHPIRQIWALWDQTQVEPDQAKRDALFKQLIDIHKEHPYAIGIVGEAPVLYITSNRFGNVASGYIDDDTLRNSGQLNPPQFFIKS